MRLEDTPEFQKGRTGEHVVADFLKDLGYYVIPSYDYSGKEESKAPQLQGLIEQYVIPDLDVAKEGRRRWVEVKTKYDATYTRITHRYEHGLPLRHFRDYQTVQEITGTQAGIAIYEEVSNCILLAWIDDLAPHARYSDMKQNGVKKEAMVYFDRRLFKMLRQLALFDV